MGNTDFVRIKIGQINAGRSKCVMSELRQIINTNNLDILCIQEPYWCHGTLGSFPSNMTQLFHQPMSWVAIVVINPLLTVTKISLMTSFALQK